MRAKTGDVGYLPPGARRSQLLLSLVRVSTPAVLFGVLLALSAARAPAFFSSANLAGLVAEAAPLILSTLAITPVALSAPAGIDLSIGPLVVLVNVALVQWLFQAGINDPFAVFGFAIGLACAFEALQGLVIALVRLQPVIVTLSGYLVLGGLNLVILPQAGGTVPTWLSNLGSPSSIFSPCLYVLVACIAVWPVLARTPLLRNVRLLGGNERAAYVSGLDRVGTRVGAHLLAGFFAGVAGVFLSGLLGSADPTAGSSETLMTVTALVVGGVSLSGGEGGAFGAILGALDVFLIGFVLGTFQLGEASSYADEAGYGVVLVGALLTGKLTMARARRRGAGLGLPATATGPDVPFEPVAGQLGREQGVERQQTR